MAVEFIKCISSTFIGNVHYKTTVPGFLVVENPVLLGQGQDEQGNVVNTMELLTFERGQTGFVAKIGLHCIEYRAMLDRAHPLIKAYMNRLESYNQQVQEARKKQEEEKAKQNLSIVGEGKGPTENG